MADEFDPYHVWLGIPPEEQPPNYYRLLGIRLFETNPAVIDGAADRQAAHLRTFQNGANSKLSQRLLNEVAAARVRLLDAEKKAAYDQKVLAAMPGSSPSAASSSSIRRSTAPNPSGSKVATSAAVNTPTPSILPSATPFASSEPAAGWDELICRARINSHASKRTPARPVGKRQSKSNSLIYTCVGIGALLAVAVAVGLVMLNSNSDGQLVFDWPAGDRVDATLKVDDQSVAVPAVGPGEYRCSPGDHRIVASRPGFKFESTVSLAKGQRQTITLQWKPKALLVLNWPLAERQGAALVVDNHAQSLSQNEPLELPIEPGRHTVRITRPGAQPFESSTTVAADQRQAIFVPAPQATLVLNWPVDQRADAQLSIDDKPAAIDANGAQLEFQLTPGRHEIRAVRRGFEPFEQVANLPSGSNTPIALTWTPLPARPQQSATTPEVTVEPKPQVATPPDGTASETAAPVAVRHPVPSAAEQARIAKQLDDVYKVAHSPDKDRALARKLFKAADEPGASPDERYMLLMKGIGLAAGAGDLELACHRIDQVNADFEIDAVAAKQKFLEEAVKTATTAEQIVVIVGAAESLADQAIAADLYDSALTAVATAAKAIGKQFTEAQFRKHTEELLVRRRREIAALQTAWPAAKEARRALEANADDGSANLTLGRWYAQYKGDWDRGLPLLAKGSDEQLKAIAKQELAADLDAKQQVLVADAWWELALKETGLPRDGARRHAGDLYRLALPNLESPLKKATIEQRLGEIASLDTPGNHAINGLPSGAVLLFTFDRGSFTQLNGKSYVKDLSGHGNHGFVSGTETVDGRVGTGLSFKGKNDYVECKYSDSFNPTTALTICAWIKVRQWRKGYIVSNEDWRDGGSYGYVLRADEQNPGKMEFVIGDGGKWHHAKSDERLDLNQWHHIACRYDNKSLVMFVDGDKGRPLPVEGPVSPATVNLRIGCGNWDTDRDFDGIIDELAIFARALSDKEVQAVYEMGVKGQSLARSVRKAQ